MQSFRNCLLLTLFYCTLLVALSSLGGTASLAHASETTTSLPNQSSSTIPLIVLGPGLYCNSQLTSSARFFTLNLGNQSSWTGNLTLNSTTTQYVSSLSRYVGYLTQVYNNYQFPSNGGGGGSSSNGNQGSSSDSSLDPTKGPMAWTWANTSVASPLPWVAAATEPVPCSYLPSGQQDSSSLTCYTPATALNDGFPFSALEPVLQFLGQPESGYSWQVVVGANGTGGLNLVDTVYRRGYLFLNSTCDCQSSDAFASANMTAPATNCRTQCASPVGADNTGFNYYLLSASSVTPFSAMMTVNLLPFPLTEPRYATPLTLPSPLPEYYAIGSASIVVLKLMAHYGDQTSTLAPILGADVPSLHKFLLLSCLEVSLLSFSHQDPSTIRDLLLTPTGDKLKPFGVGGLCSDGGQWRLLFLPPNQEALDLEDLNTTVWVMRRDSFGAVDEKLFSAFLVLVTKSDGFEPTIQGFPQLLQRIKEDFQGDAPVRSIDNLDYARWNSTQLHLKLEGDENHYFNRESCSENAKEVMCDPMAIGGAYIHGSNVSTTSSAIPVEPAFAHYCGSNTSLSGASLLLNTAGIVAEAERYAQEMAETSKYKYLGIFPLPQTPRGFEWTRTDSTGAVRKGWHPLNSPFSLRDFGASANLTVDVVNETSQETTVDSTARCEAISLPSKCSYKPCVPIDNTRIFRSILPWLIQVMATDPDVARDCLQVFLLPFRSVTLKALPDIRLLLAFMESSPVLYEAFFTSCLMGESCGVAGMFALEKVAAAHLSQNPLAYQVTREDLISMIPGSYIDRCLVLDDVVSYAQNPVTKATCTAEGTLVWTPWNSSSQGRLLSVLVSNRSILMSYYNISATCSSCLSFIAPHMHPIAKIVTLVASVFAVLWCVAVFGLDAALDRGNCNPRLTACWSGIWSSLATHNIAADKLVTERQLQAAMKNTRFTRKKLADRLGEVVGANIPIQHPFLDYYLDNLSFSRRCVVCADAHRDLQQRLRSIYLRLQEKVVTSDEVDPQSSGEALVLTSTLQAAGLSCDTAGIAPAAGEGTEMTDTASAFTGESGSLSLETDTAGVVGELTPNSKSILQESLPQKIVDEGSTAEQLLRDEMLACKKQLDEDRTQREPMSYFENVFERALCPPQWFLVIGALYCLVVALASIQHAVTEPMQFQHYLSRGLVAFFPYVNCLALPFTLVHICLRQRSLGLPILKDNILRGLILLSLLPLLCCFLGAILYSGVPIIGIVGAAAVEYGMGWLDRQVFLGHKFALLGKVFAIPRGLRVPIGFLRLLSRIALYFCVAYFGSLSYNIGALYLEMQQQPLEYLLQYEADARVIYCGWRQLYEGPFASVLQVIPMIPFPPF